jgi:lysophospholipase L1-like esterase
MTQIRHVLTLSIGLINATAFAAAAAAESVLIDDPLIGKTTGALMGGTLGAEGYQPGLGSAHILYQLPATLTDGAIEIEMRGMTTAGIPRVAESKAAWLSMYDGRDIKEPANYDRDFKPNFFRCNIGWDFERNRFQCTLSAAAPTPGRIAADSPRFGPQFEDRDFSREPLTPPLPWDPSHWYHLRYEWQGGHHRLLVDGKEVWSLRCPYPYAPREHRLRVGAAPGRNVKFHNQIAALTYRNLRVLALPPKPLPVLADHPTKKDDPTGKFLANHAEFLARGKAAPIDLLFVGDSITEQWAKHPELWQKYFGSYQAANFGIGGDRTEHVLWRLREGEIDGLKPKVVVLLIGTNNTDTHTAPEIALAVRRILRDLLVKLPETKVLLMGIFPRGERVNSDGSIDTGVARMAVIRELNPLLATLSQGTSPDTPGTIDRWYEALEEALLRGNRIQYLDLTERFVAADGTISKELMPDQFHLSAEGYKTWGKALQPILNEWLP